MRRERNLTTVLEFRIIIPAAKVPITHSYNAMIFVCTVLAYIICIPSVLFGLCVGIELATR